MFVTPIDIFHAAQIYSVIHLGAWAIIKLLPVIGRKMNEERHKLISMHYESNHEGHVKHCYSGLCHKLSTTDSL